MISMLTFTHYLMSQTYIGPTCGIDISTITKNSFHSIVFEIDENPYTHKSFTFGIQVEHSLNKKSLIGLRSAFTSKEVNMFTNGILPLDRISYWHYKNSLEFKYLLFKKFQLGTGFHYNFGREYSISSKYQNRVSNLFQNEFDDLGYLFSTGYSIHRVLFEVVWYRSFSIKYDEPKQPYLLHPTNSVAVSVSYLFKIKEKPKSDKIECPRF